MIADFHDYKFNELYKFESLDTLIIDYRNFFLLKKKSKVKLKSKNIYRVYDEE